MTLRQSAAFALQSSLREYFVNRMVMVVDAGGCDGAPASFEPCRTAGDASRGRWIRFADDTIGDLAAWRDNVLEVTRDEWVWVPYGCTLRPLSRHQIRALWRNLSVCAVGDSYLRTTLAGFLNWAGVLSDAALRRYEYSQKAWIEGDVHFFFTWDAASSLVERCLDRRDVGLVLTSQLGKQYSFLDGTTPCADARPPHLHLLGHPWSADIKLAKRDDRRPWTTSRRIAP